jgi:hypothetical protein
MEMADDNSDDAAGSSSGFFPATGGWPRCVECTSILRPAVHMFGEDNTALLQHLKTEEGRYVHWECEMEKAVRGLSDAARPPQRVVLVELGCGLRVPSVRLEMEEVLRDLLDKLAEEEEEEEGTGDALARATLVRINTDFPQCPLPMQEARQPQQPKARARWPEQTIEIGTGALEALTAIDRHVQRIVKEKADG